MTIYLHINVIKQQYMFRIDFKLILMTVFVKALPNTRLNIIEMYICKTGTVFASQVSCNIMKGMSRSVMN